MAHGPTPIRSLAAALAVGLSALPAGAQLSVSNLKRYQVLQRDTGAMVATYTDSGSCKAGTSKIQFQLSGQNSGTAVLAWKDMTDLSVSGTRWKGTVSGLPVGGEYKAQLRSMDGSGSVTETMTAVENVLVGDVWICAGQSNMMGEAGTTLNTSKVHTRVLWAAQPGATETAPWGTTLTKGPSTSFANKLSSLTNIPVGIIYAAQGGTSISDWYYTKASGELIFTSMKKFMNAGPGGWKIGGFLWYQGENEDQQDTWATRYFTKFSRMREEIRTLSKNANLPFVLVQLESWDGVTDYPLDPYSRWIRWPIIRDQQELLGRLDARSTTAPIWTEKGIHIVGASEAKLGERCAAKAVRKFYAGVAADPGAGPEFKAAWFQDETRKNVVVQFSGVTGKLVNPADPNHLGFYVMTPKVFNINDSTIFAYLKDSKGTPAKMLKEISSMETLDNDKVVIHLASPATDSVTVGYARHIQLTALSPLTDGSGIPVNTFFNRTISATAPSAMALPSTTTRSASLRLEGSVLHLDGASAASISEVVVRDVAGKILTRRIVRGSTLDLHDLRGHGILLVGAKMDGQILPTRALQFSIAR